MKTNLAKFGNVILLILAVILISSCAKPKIYRDDAVRIKAGREDNYHSRQNSSVPRNGNTLRGEVLKIEVEATPDSCPVNPFTKYNTKSFVLFVDSLQKSDNVIERIPLDDVELIGPKLSISQNQYGNINYFETYNNPLLPLEIREVPVDTIYKDPCTTPCPCEQISVKVPCLLCFNCPERELDFWFLEGKFGMAIYNDINKFGNTVGRDDWLVDLAVGLRLGESKRWGLGIFASTGVETFNRIDSTITKKPTIALYGRYDFIREKKVIKTKDMLEQEQKKMVIYDSVMTKTYDGCSDSVIVIAKINPNYLANPSDFQNNQEIEVRPCLNPFIYGFLGAAVDKFSIDLFKINFNEDCRDRIDTEAPGIDISMPINFGIGVGVEYPLTSYLDLSLDLGFRSVSFGDKAVNNGLLVPTNRRFNAVVFRIGLTY